MEIPPPYGGNANIGIPQPYVQTVDDAFPLGNLGNLDDLGDLDDVDMGVQIGIFFNQNDHDQLTMIPPDQATMLPVVQATTIPVVQPIYTDAAHELAPAETNHMSGIRFVAGLVMDTIKGGKTSLYEQLKNTRGHTFLTTGAMMELASKYEIVLMQEQKLTPEELTFLKEQPLKKIVWMGAPIGETFFKVHLNNWFDSKSNEICRRG